VWKFQDKVKACYYSNNVQIIIATLILVHFMIQCIEKEVDPTGLKYAHVWMRIGDVFNVIFTIELAFNMYGSWLRPFCRSGWNIFDTMVVAIGILDLVRAPLPDQLTMIRMLRAFRVFRLFNRVPSLKKIVDSLKHAIPGVINAFAVSLLTMCIYAVLCVDLFYNLYHDCNMPGQPAYGTTSRKMCIGEDYYGNFFSSLYTLFQVLTGESWSEAVVRPTWAYFLTNPVDSAAVALFWVSFIMIHSVVLLNIVVAFVLDGMNQSADEAEAREAHTKNGDCGNSDQVPAEDPSLSPQITELRQELTSVKLLLNETTSEVTDIFSRVLDKVNKRANPDERGNLGMCKVCL